jgi:quinol-cytochrome oxidoreductase complex cytochrome b subunit
MKLEILFFTISLVLILILTLFLVYFILDPWLNGKKNSVLALRVSVATALSYFVFYLIAKFENIISKKDRAEFLKSLKKSEYWLGFLLGYLMIVLIFFGMFS